MRSTQAARRTKSRVPGVFYREGKHGRSYELTYRDSSGKQRWQSGFRTLSEAQDARGEVLRRLRRGARVEPIRITFADFARQWLAGQTELRPSTRARYEWAIRVHLVPRLGRLRLSEVSEDVVVGLIHTMRAKQLKASTIKAVLGTLSLILGRAVRRGALSHNAVQGLERAERPAGQKRAMRILGRDELEQLIRCTHPDHRALISTLAFTGLRISEALGLRWADVDLEHGQIHVRGQLDHRTRVLVDGKTPSSRRSIVLMPSLGRMLREHRLSSRFSSDTDFVFASNVGTPMKRDNVRSRILHPAVKLAGLDEPGKPKLRLHDLRHCFASLLIAGGASVVFVAGQLGHSSPTVTLSTYSHLFDERDHADRMSAILEDGFGSTLETASRGEARSDAVTDAANPTPLRPSAAQRGPAR